VSRRLPTMWEVSSTKRASLMTDSRPLVNVLGPSRIIEASLTSSLVRRDSPIFHLRSQNSAFFPPSNRRIRVRSLIYGPGRCNQELQALVVSLHPFLTSFHLLEGVLDRSVPLPWFRPLIPSLLLRRDGSSPRPHYRRKPPRHVFLSLFCRASLSFGRVFSLPGSGTCYTRGPL